MNSTSAYYARALFTVAEADGSAACVLDELRALESLLREFDSFFKNPSVPSEIHALVMKSTLDGQAAPLTVRFLELLAHAGKLSLLPRIRQTFESLAESVADGITVTIKTRYELSEDSLNALRAGLAKNGLYAVDEQEKVDFKIIVDERILGGFIAECRGRVIDASLRSRLEKLKA